MIDRGVEKNSINKVVFFIETSFSTNNYQRFGVDIFLKNGFEVHIVDFTPLLNPKWHEQVQGQGAERFENLTYVSNESEIYKKLIVFNKNSFVINFLLFSFTTYKVFRFVSKYKIPYAVIAWSGIVFEPRFLEKKLSFTEKITNKLKKFRVTSIPQYMLARLPLVCLGLKPARYVFAAGSSSNLNLKSVGKYTEIVWIHSFDYDRYLDSVRTPNERSNTIVFFDQNLPFHIDFIKSPVTNLPKPDTYFPVLCSAFDKIESAFDARVIICGHPSADKRVLAELYGGREVVIGKTNVVVRSCIFCIAHWSTSINYAVMNRKAILFVTTNSLEKSSLSFRLHTISSYFKKTVTNVSNDFFIDEEEVLYQDHEIYERYMNEFVKKNYDYDGKFWEVVVNKLKIL